MTFQSVWEEFALRAPPVHWMLTEYSIIPRELRYLPTSITFHRSSNEHDFLFQPACHAEMIRQNGLIRETGYTWADANYYLRPFRWRKIAHQAVTCMPCRLVLIEAFGALYDEQNEKMTLEGELIA